MVIVDLGIGYVLGVLLLLLRKGLDDTREVLGPKRSVQKSFLIMLEKCAL